jgi:membrane complex biogenesis BtpA family protein
VGVVGMVHLLPLPGSPRWAGSMEAVVRRAVADARALAAGPVDALLVENYGDVPFLPGPVPAETVAALAAAVAAVRDAADRPVGVNVLRNDAAAALAIAAATGCRFIRVNVHTGSMFTDQGLIHGQAGPTLRARARLAPDVAILADVMVKHAAPPPGLDLGRAARDAWDRGLADALVVSSRTGSPTPPSSWAAASRPPPSARPWTWPTASSSAPRSRTPPAAPSTRPASKRSWPPPGTDAGPPATTVCPGLRGLSCRELWVRRNSRSDRSLRVRGDPARLSSRELWVRGNSRSDKGFRARGGPRAQFAGTVGSLEARGSADCRSAQFVAAVGPSKWEGRPTAAALSSRELWVPRSERVGRLPWRSVRGNCGSGPGVLTRAGGRPAGRGAD